jgi:hypothetical protein
LFSRLAGRDKLNARDRGKKMINQSELYDTLGDVFGYKDNDDASLLSHLAFIAMQLERIANSLEKTNSNKYEVENENN